MKSELVFVRHAQSIGNIMSQTERSVLETPNNAYPLTDLGRKQARIAGVYLREEYGSDYFDMFINSSYLRTQETMGIILEELGCSHIVPISDSRLYEKWDGIFHELSMAEIMSRYPDQIRSRKKTGYYHYRAPGGQNCPDVEMQVRSFLSDYCIGNHQKILCVGHGRWSKIFRKLFHDLSIEEYLQRLDTENCDNASVNVYTFSKEGNIDHGSVTPWEGKLSTIQNTYA